MTTNGGLGPVAARAGPAPPSGGIRGECVKYGVALAVALASVVAFLPVLDNGFVSQWDDQPNFLDNHAFRGLGWPQVRWAWTTMLQGAYQPLAWMLLEAQYVAWGLDPRGYHVASVLLHAVNALLFFALTRALVSRVFPEIQRSRPWAISVISGVAAALFAVHPLRVEVVAWASCQPYLPCAGFVLLSVLAYLRGVSGRRRHAGWLFASAGLFAAALGCKAVAVGLPLVLLVLDAAVLNRLLARKAVPGVLAEKVLYLVPAFAVAVIALLAKLEPPPTNEFRPSTAQVAARRVAVAGYALGYYLRKTIWPRNLTAYHFRPDPVDPLEPRFVGSVAAVVVAGVVVYRLRRRWPALAAAAVSYAILLGPNLGLVSYDLMLVADRYSYLATMPLFLLAAGGLAHTIALSRRPGLVALAQTVAALGVLCILAALSWAQCATWRNSAALVAHGLRVGSGRDALLESNFGVDLCAAGRAQEGLVHLIRAVLIDPNDADAQENLGVMLVGRGELERALVHLAEAARLAPFRFDLRHHLGVALSRRGRLDEAAAQLAEAVRLRPTSAPVRVSLADVLIRLKRYDEAAAQYNQAARLEGSQPGRRRGAR